MYNTNKYRALLLVLGIAIAFGFNKISEDSASINTSAEDSLTQQKNKVSDKKVLLGNWTRTDADYKIKISEVLKDGKLNAGYFNPKSINVGKATWTSVKGVLKIYIELRDENYPGSNYNLTYNPEKDMLTGKYFQAVTGETYDVLFARTK
jgi:hypothetical protein